MHPESELLVSAILSIIMISYDKSILLNILRIMKKLIVNFTILKSVSTVLPQ
jgi:hypothetical protein